MNNIESRVNETRTVRESAQMWMKVCESERTSVKVCERDREQEQIIATVKILNPLEKKS